MYGNEEYEEPLDGSWLARIIPDDTLDKVIAEMSAEETNGID